MQKIHRAIPATDMKKRIRIRQENRRPSTMRKDALTILRGIASNTRLEILIVLRNHGKICVQDIKDELHMTHSAISHQLAVLNGVGMVEHKKNGRMQMYSISKNPVGRKANRIVALLLK